MSILHNSSLRRATLRLGETMVRDLLRCRLAQPTKAVEPPPPRVSQILLVPAKCPAPEARKKLAHTEASVREAGSVGWQQNEIERRRCGTSLPVQPFSKTHAS